MNLVLFGPPGAGKGTQADNLAREFNLFKVSTGALLRDEIKKNTSLGIKIKSLIDKGELAPDEIIYNLIKNILSNNKYYNRVIFDGYPRNLNQARNLNNLLSKHDQKIDIVLKLSVSLEIIKKRINERQTLEKRTDDNEHTAIKRYETYENKIKPVVDFYKQSNLLKVVNGENSITEISNEISDLIDGLKG